MNRVIVEGTAPGRWQTVVHWVMNPQVRALTETKATAPSSAGARTPAGHGSRAT